jgi:hypothetical protein
VAGSLEYDVADNDANDWKDVPHASALSEAQVARVRALVADGLTLDERWAAYGRGYGYAASGGDLVQRVKDAVRDRLDELRSLLCKDQGILKVAASPQTGIALGLAFAVTGKLVAAQFHDVDVIQLGVLIAQGGLLMICQGSL